MKAKENTRIISKRSLARLMAVQILYRHEYHLDKSDILIIMEEMIDNYTFDSDQEIKSYRKNTDVVFLRNLLSGLILVLDKIDEKIKNSLEKNNSFEQIPDVMLQVLRFGAFELQFMKDSPFKAIINEYVNIAATFYDSNKVNFVNAILDKIAKENDK